MGFKIPRGACGVGPWGKRESRKLKVRAWRVNKNFPNRNGRTSRTKLRTRKGWSLPKSTMKGQGKRVHSLSKREGPRSRQGQRQQLEKEKGGK